jgi:short-subunit dehydrogenase
MEIARSLARRGLGTTLVARRTERLEALAHELRGETGVRVETLAVDLAEVGGPRRLQSQLEELGVAVEVLVNNAGFGSGGRFQDLDPERELEMVRLNVEAVVALCGAFVPAMVRRGRGGVLNVASTAAFQPLPRQATYGATKAFVLSFTDALHADLRGTGVTATTLCPGPVKTEFTEAAGIDADAEGLPEVFWTEADFVAEQGIRGLERGRRVVVPGRINQAGALGGQHAPRSLLLRFANRVSPIGR